MVTAIATTTPNGPRFRGGPRFLQRQQRLQLQLLQEPEPPLSDDTREHEGSDHRDEKLVRLIRPRVKIF